MRVLVYGMSFDKLGGIETFLLNMKRHMSPVVFFDYVLEGFETMHAAEIQQSGGELFLIAPKRDMLKNIRDWRMLIKARKDKNQLAYFNMYSLSWVIPIIMCRIAGIPVVVHSHNNRIHNCGIAVKVLHHLGKLALRFMNVKRLTNSKASSKYLFGNPERGEIVYNAIDTERFSYNECIRKRMRNMLGISDEVRLIGTVGRFSYQKNPLYLLEIFEALCEQETNVRLMMVGDGDLMPEVRERIRERRLEKLVFLPGNQKNIEDYYQAMDVFVLPSRFEGLGIVLVEAQACGLPCLASADVIPSEARVTDLLRYMPLENGPAVWAEQIREMFAKTRDRYPYHDEVMNSNYDIRKEAGRLEQILTAYARQGDR